MSAKLKFTTEVMDALSPEAYVLDQNRLGGISIYIQRGECVESILLTDDEASELLEWLKKRNGECQ